jgi:hypothetical protein
MSSKAENSLTRQQVYSQLIKSPHGNLNEYLPIGLKAVKEDPDFFAHLVAWNSRKGEVRDAKSALALIALTNPTEPEYQDNALAVLATLGVRDLIKALRWVEGKDLVTYVTEGTGKKKVRKKVLTKSAFPKAGINRTLRRFVAQYLSNLEANRAHWDAVALQNKQSLKYLYRKYRVEPSDRANGVLFGPSTKRPDNPTRPQGSVFEKLPLLKNLEPAFVAGALTALKVPFLTGRGAVESKAKDPMVLQALMASMSPAELLNSTKMLERWGMKDNPALKAAYEKGLNKAADSKKPMATLKAGKAASMVTDEKLKAKLNTLQEAKLDQKQIKGNWLVLGDRSPSMEGQSVEVAKAVAGILARLAETCTLIFFDQGVQRIDVTGLTMEQVVEKTKAIKANGSGTSIGAGIDYALVNNLDVDGIAIVSDGEENSAPWSHQVLPKLNAALGKDIPVYYYRVRRDRNRRFYGNVGLETFPEHMKQAKLDFQTFEIDADNIDYYSLPNLVASMRVNKYAFTDEIMDTPLRTTDEVFKNLRKQRQFEEDAEHVSV